VREPTVVGWDVGGAHLKGALLRAGEVLDAAQWACPLWQGTDALVAALAAARARWPDLDAHRHAVTMTGEMVDLFAHREDGVRRIAAMLHDALPAPRFYAGDAGWCDAAGAGAAWAQIASANWLATTRHAARVLEGDAGLLVDVGSTTTDLVAFRAGRVLTDSRSDAQRLERGELVYQGVVRTPLCALAQRIAWRSTEMNVMNEWFATSADVYRITGELDPAHDQQASADHAAKDVAGSQARLARMIGLDARDGSAADWLAFAHTWRAQQLALLRDELARQIAAHALHAGSVLVSAGCGTFLAAELTPPRWRHIAYGRDLVRIAAGAPRATQGWVQVCATSVAVAALHEQGRS
jgi:(4-(4-[2-(gamma-L-glutamylamino)ethyl]phenoxymethyl)furan-2-yl)methanamine synthase